jgi:uridine kinase
MLVIGIAGGTGSGKTSVATSIVEKLGAESVSLISQDSYYVDHADLSFEDRQALNYDHPDSFDNVLLLTHLKQLRKGHDIDLPLYDYTLHRRKEHRLRLEHKPVVVLEGIHVLVDAALREELDIKVFVDTDGDVRVLRRVMRDIQERGRSLESVYEQYLTTVKPMHDAFIEPSKRYADLIVPEGGENEIAINLLTAQIGQFLHHHASTQA